MRSSKIPVFFKFQISSVHIAILYFSISAGLSVYLRANTAAVDGFFAELGNVSAALASGQGFSNVFDHNSGPTAWCPPLNVLSYAAIFKVFGVKTEASFWALVMIRCLLFAVVLFWMLEINYSKTINKYKILLFPIFLLYTSLVIYRTGPKDAMFAIFLSMLLIYTITKIWEYQASERKMVLYLMALLLPLANISLAIGFLLFIMVHLFLSSRIINMGLKPATAGLLVLTMAFSYTLWGFRNTQALDKFIPFKSNLWFELYISNVVDDDGILKYSNYEKFHPYNNSQVANTYKERGEVDFLEDYRLASIEYLKANPVDFTVKIFNRFTNIFIFAESEKDLEVANTEVFYPQDLKLLEKHNLLVDNYWVCLEYTKVAFEQALSDIHLANPNVILVDWERKVLLSNERVNNTASIKEYLKSLLTSIIPTLAILFGLFIPGIRNSKIFALTLIMFILSIAPYLVISWTPRYQSFQIGFFSIFLFMMLAYVIEFIGNRIKRNSFLSQGLNSTRSS